MEELVKKLAKIQQELTCKKGQTNAFRNYKYRSCEDILEAVKPLLGELSLIIGDKMVKLGDRYYVKATVSLSDGKEFIKISAYAREAEIKKGMDVSQITGATSSYARKYALNGLFAIDDTKDADTQDADTQDADTQDADTQDNTVVDKPATSATNKICNLCGADAVTNPKNNNLFCPEYLKHNDGERYVIIDKPTEQDLTFGKDMPEKK